jgi:hypothetical protein
MADPISDLARLLARTGQGARLEFGTATAASGSVATVVMDGGGTIQCGWSTAVASIGSGQRCVVAITGAQALVLVTF